MKKQDRGMKIAAAVVGAVAAASVLAVVFFFFIRPDLRKGGPVTDSPAVVTPTEATSAPVDPENTELSEAEGKEALERMVGCWNSGDNATFICISRKEDGGYHFTHGRWYSDFGIIGDLIAPFRGDPQGQISIRLFYESDDASGESLVPSVDEDLTFDLSRLADKQLRERSDSDWETFYYAGATMDEAIPPQNAPAVTEAEQTTVVVSEDTTLTPEKAADVLQKLVGCWRIPDSRYFLQIKKEGDDYSLGYAFFEGEVDLYGYLQQPFRGDPEHTVDMRWYYKGYTSENGYVMPSIDADISFDLSGLSEGQIRWYYNGKWTDCIYTGKDISDVSRYWYGNGTDG